jgi:hypothetical protein
VLWLAKTPETTVSDLRMPLPELRNVALGPVQSETAQFFADAISARKQ